MFVFKTYALYKINKVNSYASDCIETNAIKFCNKTKLQTNNCFLHKMRRILKTFTIKLDFERIIAVYISYSDLFKFCD